MPGEKPVDHGRRERLAPALQLLSYLFEREIGLATSQTEQVRLMRLDASRALVAAHRAGPRFPCLVKALLPSHDARDADDEPSGRRPARQPLRRYRR